MLAPRRAALDWVGAAPVSEASGRLGRSQPPHPLERALEARTRALARRARAAALRSPSPAQREKTTQPKRTRRSPRGARPRSTGAGRSQPDSFRRRLQFFDGCFTRRLAGGGRLVIEGVRGQLQRIVECGVPRLGGAARLMTGRENGRGPAWTVHIAQRWGPTAHGEPHPRRARRGVRHPSERRGHIGFLRRFLFAARRRPRDGDGHGDGNLEPEILRWGHQAKLARMSGARTEIESAV